MIVGADSLAVIPFKLTSTNQFHFINAYLLLLIYTDNCYSTNKLKDIICHLQNILIKDVHEGPTHLFALIASIDEVQGE